MSDFIPKPGTVKVGGLGRKAQKLQALREKAAAQAQNGAKPASGNAFTAYKAKESHTPTKKVPFQRKAV